MTVAITGASGFIGGRLAALLATGDGSIRPRVIRRRRGGASDGRDVRSIDLLDSSAVADALAGCSAVVHCAFDFANPDANVEIARVLGRACATAGIRLVHISTAAVYEPLPDGALDESGGNDGPSSDYKQSKLAIETLLLRQSREIGLAVVILQPAIVYGPYGRAWTDSPVREMLTGIVVLPAAGRGLCNAVYVDDVCQAAIAALTAPVRSGERFLISGAAPVTWRDFYGAYQAVLGLDALQFSPEADSGPTVDEPAMAPRRRAAVKRTATRLLGARRLSQLNLAVSYVRGLLSQRQHRATGPKLALLRARCHLRIDKAQRLLGYQPEFDLDRGMQMTAPYLRASYGRLARIRRRGAPGKAAPGPIPPSALPHSP